MSKTQEAINKYIETKNRVDRDNAICILYKNNELIGKIAKILSIERHTVTRVLKEKKIYKSDRSIRHLNNDKIKRNKIVIQSYISGMTFREIEKQFGIPKNTANYIVKTFINNNIPEYNLSLDNKEKIIRTRRKYFFNEDFFEVIDTQEKAYWLGFLYADGCVTEDGIKVELQESDYGHLEKLNLSLNASNKTIKITSRKNKDNKYCLVYYNSKKMVQDLINHGCFIRKTGILKFPSSDQVPDELIVHFMRGYFDGDGCIYQRKIKSGVNSFSVIGNECFIEEYNRKISLLLKKDKLVKLTNVSTTGYKNLILGGNKQIKKIYDILYKDATIYLDRKKEKFEAIIKRPACFNAAEETGYDGGIKRESRKDIKSQVTRTEGLSKISQGQSVESEKI